MAAQLDENIQYTDPTTGELLANGYIYIGADGLDAKLNLISIYSDRGLMTSLSNPQRIGSDGRAENKIWVPSKYSMKVENYENVQKLNDLSLGEAAQTGNTILDNVQGINALTADASPTVTTLIDKQAYILTAVSTNTSAMTLTIDLTPTWPIKKHHDKAMEANDIEADQVLAVIWNETDSVFEQMTNSAIESYSKAESDALTATVYTGTASGTADAITATLSPTLASLADKSIVSLRALFPNATATPTFAPDGLAAWTIVKNGRQPLVAGDIAGPNHELWLKLNATNTEVELLNPAILFASSAEVATGTEAAKAVTPLTQGDHQTAAKAWVNFNGQGTVAIRDSFNVSSITDNGTGNYTINFTNPMSNANYSITGSCGGNIGFVRINALAAATAQITTYRDSAVTFDADPVNAVIFGE